MVNRMAKSFGVVLALLILILGAGLSRELSRPPASEHAAKQLEKRLLEKTVGLEIQLPRTIRSVSVPVSKGQPLLHRLYLDGLLKSDGWAANRVIAVTFVLDETNGEEPFTLIHAYAYTSRTWYFYDIGTVTFPNSQFYDTCREYAQKMTPPENFMGGRDEEDSDVLTPYAVSLYRKDVAEGKDTGTKLYAEKKLRKHEAALEKLHQEAEEAAGRKGNANGAGQTQGQ